MTVASSEDTSPAPPVVDETTALLAENSSNHHGTTLLQPDASQTQEEATDDTKDAQQPSRVSPTAVVMVLVVGTFIAQLDTSFVLATHSQIASEFNRLSESSWVIVSYSLAMCAVQPLYGKLSDIFGRRACLILAYTLFAIGSLVCGIATSLGGVITGRVIAGAGGAGVWALVSLIILDLVPLREVARLRSYVNIASTLGRSSGGPIGGALTDAIGWRWAFIIQAPLLFISGLIAAPLVPGRKETEGLSLSQKLRRIDFAGAGLIAVSVTTFMMVLEITGPEVPWIAPIVLILLACSAVSGILFVVVETRWAAEPVFPLILLRKRDVVASYLLFGLQVSAQFSLMFCVPLYFEIIHNASSAIAGAHLFPAVVGNTLGALMVGWIIHNTGKYKLLAVLAPICGSFCYTLLIIRWRGSTNVWESLYIFPGGFGAGMAEATAFISLSAAVEKSMHAVALSGLFQSVNIGGIVGLTVSSAVLRLTLRSKLESSLDAYPNKQEILEKAVSDISYVMHLRGNLHEIVVGCYVKALENTHAVSLGLSLSALIAALAIKEHAL